MAAKSLAVVLAIATIVSGVHSQIVLRQNHEEITVKTGDAAELVCTSDHEALGCSFRSPVDQPYNLLKGANYEQGRIQQYETDNPKDCAMKIDRIEESDNGEWECSVTAKGPTGDYQIGKGKVQVVVAVPPSSVALKMDGQPITGPIDMNLDDQKQAFIDCVASGARPAPTQFIWWIGQTQLNAEITTREEAGENGKMNYISTLEYNAAPKHSGQEIKCQVDHTGYTTQQIADETNWAKATLNLQFKPDEKPDKQTFYGLKDGEENTVRFQFMANPKPSAGVWKIGETTVPIGAANTENTLTSSQIEDGDLPGQYVVVLKFTMDEGLVGKTYALEVENNLGKTSYQFDLALADKPKTDEANGPVIGIVILVVIIILVGGVIVIARAKGALCFGAKSGGEPLEEEKEAFDDAEKGKLAPSTVDVQVKSTPEKKPEVAPETKPETEENKEEKKSNGAHTPV